MPDLRLTWADFPGGYGTEVTGPATIDTGGVEVTVDVNTQSESATAFALNLNTFDDPADDLPPDSQLKLISDGGTAGDTSVTTLSFASSDPLFGDNVTDLTFRIDDIDTGPDGDIDGSGMSPHEDIVNIRAFDAAGNEVPVTLTPGGGMTVAGQTATGGIQGLPTDGTQSLLVEIAGPVARVEIDYDNGDVGEQEILVSDLLFTTTDPIDNDGPTAVDDAATTAEDTLLEDIPVLDNDSDPDGDPLEVLSASAPNGTVTINPDGTLNYLPDPGFTGEDTITYTITDNISGTDTADVVITVTEDPNSAPEATDDVATTPEDTLLEDIPVLDNDSDPDGDTLEVVGATAPNGTVTINPDGTLNYLPDPGFTGEDTITYTVEDPGGLTDTASVVVTITENDPPVAVDDPALTTPLDTLIEDIPVLDNDSDPDGDTLEVTTASAPNGTVTINPDGTLDYLPDPGFEGTDTVTYTITDNISGSDTATFEVTVGDPNSAPEATDDVASTPVDTLLEDIPVLDNDSDPDGDTLEVTAATAPNGTVTINPDFTLNYLPDPGFTGVDTITYTITDNISGSDTAQVIVTIRDGIVSGTPGDDTISLGTTTDPDGDVIDNGDAILPGEAPDDDIVEAGDGNDSILTFLGDDDVDAGAGDDTVETGTGDDIVDGGTGEDVIDTGDGADTVDGGDDDDVINTSGTAPDINATTFPSAPVDALPEDDEDSVIGGAGNDTITTGDDDDTIIGGEGDDVINSGIDDDSVLGGDGADSIIDIQGADTIDGGAGDDTILAGTDSFTDYVGDDPNLPITDGGTTFVTDPNTDDGRDSIIGGTGDDFIVTGDDADTIDGGADNDTIFAGIDDDIVDGGDGADSIEGGHGSDDIEGGEGDDYIDAGHTSTTTDFEDEPDATEPAGLELNDRDTVDGGAGNDTIFGGDDDDLISGGAGNDLIDGGIDEDTISGNDGQDTIIGGEGADSIFAGGDEDLIIGATIGDTVDGGSTGVDDDTLDLTTASLAAQATGGRIAVTYTSADREDGFVQFLDDTDTEIGRMEFTEIENVIPCFTPGTMIATPTGERAVEDLKVGDRVITRDNGIQEIRWVGAKELTGGQLAANAHLQPVLIRAGALGENMPERDMLVSPQHRMLLNTDHAGMYFEEREVLVAAKHLTMLDGVDVVESSGTTYIHIMFEQHEVVLSDGAWSESFQPGDYTLDGIGEEQRAEILELFPELETQQGVDAYQSARRALKKFEAKLLLG